MRTGTLGIIDVGTNSIHLVIGHATPRGGFRILVHERTLAKLGEGGMRRNRLAASAMRRAERVLRRYAGILARHRVDCVRAVATSAVREAVNGPGFVRRVRTGLGLPLRIISGREEARLIYRGAWQQQRFRRDVVMFAMGGGSTQVLRGTGLRLTYAVSLPLGATRLTERFIRHDPATPGEVAALRAALVQDWRQVARAVRRRGLTGAFGCSSMTGQVATAVAARAGYPDTGSITRAALSRFVEWAARSTASARRRLSGIDPGRHDLLLASGLALLTWMEACGVERLRSVSGSLREGLVVDYLKGR